MSEKVYVIKSSTPKAKSRSGKKAAAPATPPKHSKSPSANASSRANAIPISNRDRWIQVLRAYLLGPVALVLWPAGRFRTAWLALGAGSVLALVLLLTRWSAFTAWAGTSSSGALLWIVTVTIVFLSAATAWSRAVMMAGWGRPSLASIASRRLCHPAAVGALGTLIPGFGHCMLGHWRRSASLLWIIGPMVSAMVILANWRWLWSRSQTPVTPGISGTALEGLFITAAVILILTALTWIVQALDGARRFSTVTRSRVFTDAVGVVLLAALAIFAATFRPAPLGQSLGGLSTALHDEGFRLIPLRLYEAAAWLDPASPDHLARAADINEELGMVDAAEAKRYILERRMEEYVDLVRDNQREAELSLMFSSLADTPLEAIGPVPAGETWSQIRELLRAGGR